MSRWALAALWIAGATSGVAAAQNLWGPLHAGPHAVGFRVLDAGDATRHLAGSSGPRPVQIALWYPAAPSDDAALTYGDYVRVTALERSLQSASKSEAEATIQGYRRFMSGSGLSEAALDAWLTAPMAARRDAPPAAGRFPLVLVAQGNGGAAPDHALLAEFLASRGYVVATSPSPARLGDTIRGEQDILPTAETQARDLAFVLDRLRSHPLVDPSRLGVVGYSFGGRSALLFVGGQPKAGAFVSLDSGIAARAGKGWLPPGRLDPLAVRTPILHVFQDTEDSVVPDFALLAACKNSDRTLLRVTDMHHFEFLTFGMASAALPEMSQGKEPRQLARKIEAVFAYVAAFLDAQLKGDSDARGFLARAPPDNGLPERLLTLARIQAGR